MDHGVLPRPLGYVSRLSRDAVPDLGIELIESADPYRLITRQVSMIENAPPARAGLADEHAHRPLDHTAELIVIPGTGWPRQ